MRILRDEQLRLRLSSNARRTWEERLNITFYASELAHCWRSVSATEKDLVSTRAATR